jgi:hypothetical protein
MNKQEMAEDFNNRLTNSAMEVHRLTKALEEEKGKNMSLWSKVHDFERFNIDLQNSNELASRVIRELLDTIDYYKGKE